MTEGLPHAGQRSGPILVRGSGPAARTIRRNLSGARKRSVRAGDSLGAFPNAGPDDAPAQRL